jgi:hypothetical protein
VQFHIMPARERHGDAVQLLPDAYAHGDLRRQHPQRGNSQDPSSAATLSASLSPSPSGRLRLRTPARSRSSSDAPLRRRWRHPWPRIHFRPDQSLWTKNQTPISSLRPR